MLYLIGLGLGDHRDITVRGLEIVRKCAKVFLEHYTSVLGVDHRVLSEFYGREVTLADRDMVESRAEEILDAAQAEDAALLVVGDPYGATTHTDMVVRAIERGIPVQVVHNASIMNAVACTGLQLYRFGYTISVPFFTETWRPDSFYDKIKHNKSAGLHTLCLLDIKVKEPDFTAMMRGRQVFLPPRFMTVAQAASQLIEVEQRKGEGVCGPEALAVGVARVGQETQLLVHGSLAQLARADLGTPLHSLVLVGELHDMEEAMLKLFCKRPDQVPEVVAHEEEGSGSSESEGDAEA